MANSIPVIVYFNVNDHGEAKKFRDRLCEAFQESNEFLMNSFRIMAEDPSKPNEVIMILGKDNVENTFSEVKLDITFDRSKKDMGVIIG